ncbi:MAG: ABC transporter ATP-binding protein [Rickettsiaceae bacterium]|nr:MAG: ABC transporter ATP-binding protein [Rickettsiaceae bacterium]
MNKQNNYKAAYIVKRLFRDHIRPYRSRILLAIFFMIIVASCTAFIVKLVQPAIDQIFLSHDRKMLILLPVMMIGIYSVKGIAEYYQSYLIKYIGQRILTDLQMQMYKHLIYADLALIQSFSSGRLISRFTNDVSLMRGAVSNLLVGCAKHLLSIIFLIVVMFKLEPVLSAVVFFVFPIAIYPVQKLGRNIRKTLGQSQEELSNYTARLDETFQSIKIVKSFCSEKSELNQAKLIVYKILHFYKKSAKLDALVAPIMEILSGAAIGGIIWYGGVMIMDGRTTPGALFAFITAFVSAYRPFKSLISLNINLQEGLAAAKRVFHILDIEPKIKSKQNAKVAEFTKAEITIDQVCLNFGKRIAIKSCQFIIQEGKRTALVGRSGSGKTSIANLLVRFYDPSEGRILINKEDILNFSVESLRQKISYVTQDTILFDTTIAKNISYGNPQSTLEEIKNAAKLSDAHDFISRLPEGYDTMVGTQGTSLSGGQRQRLSIARAFLKNAPILILDEASSALDLESEQAILESIKQLQRGKTTLVITHRFANIIDADEIIVMKDGSVFERGNHDQLIALRGEYYQLYNKELEGERQNI